MRRRQRLEQGAKVLMMKNFLSMAQNDIGWEQLEAGPRKAAGVDFDKQELVEELMKYGFLPGGSKLIQLWADRSGNDRLAG